MNTKEIVRTAFRSLRINPLRAFLSVLGITFGIACVIALTAVGEGVKREVVTKVQGLGSHLLIVRSGEPESEAQEVSLSQRPLASSTLTKSDLEAVKDTEGVEGAYPLIQTANKIKAGKNGGESVSINAYVKGTNEDYLELNGLKVAHGRFLSDKDEGRKGEGKACVCVLGTMVAEKLFGTAGEDVLKKSVSIVYFSETTKSEEEEAFTVVGVMEERKRTVVGDPNLEVYITIGDAQRMAGASEDKISEIHAKAASEGGLEGVKARVEEAILENHDGKRDFNVRTLEDVLDTYSYIFNVLTALVVGVVLISLVQGGVGVANIMYVSVKERTKEIGVRLAQGASKKMIILQFLFESVLLSLLGALLGIPLGLIISVLVNLSILPAKPTLWAVAVAFLASFVVGVVAGVFPARQATRVEITEALRAEF